ncbi:MAG: alpha/beta fold hydrolase [Candidatus Kryptoniota bacterium]
MFIPAGAGKLSHTTFGENKNKAVVFIHGFPFDKSMWDEQCELLSKDHFVVAFDLRGHGESETGSGQYLVEFIVDDLFNVMEEAGLNAAVVGGLSIGGYAALRAVERKPSRISGLILCNTKSAADTNAAKLNRANQIKMILAGQKSQFAEDMARVLFAPESFEKNETAVNKIISIMKSTNETALVGTLIALAARMDMSDSLEQISVPTLIMTGDRDKVATQADAKFMQSRIKNSKFVLIHGAGHLSNLENSSEFNSALANFLKENNL